MSEKDTKPKTTEKPIATVRSATRQSTPTRTPTSSAAKQSTPTRATVSPAAKQSAPTRTPVSPATKQSAPTKTTVSPVAKQSAPTRTPVSSAARQSTPTRTAVSPAARSSVATTPTAKPEVKPITPTKNGSSSTKPVAVTKPVPAPAKQAEPKSAPASAATRATAPKSADKSSLSPSTQKSVKTAAMKTSEKAQKPSKERKKSKGGSGKGGAVAMTKNKKLMTIIISAVSFVLIVAIVVGIIVGTKSCNGNVGPKLSKEPPVINGATTVTYDKPASKETNILNSIDPLDPAIADLIKDAYKYEYPATTQVGYYGRVSGTVERVKPVAEIKNEGSAFDSAATGDIFKGDAARYPTYGSTMRHVIGTEPEQEAARTALIYESNYLCAWGTRGANNGGAQTPDKYTKIAADGYLYQYKDNNWIHSLKWGETEYSPANYRRLYEHTAAKGMYLEGYTRDNVTYAVSDDAPRVVKEVTMRPRGYGSYGVTGLYAPAGEVIKVEISGEDMRATGGIAIHIGQALYNGQANNIWVAKNQMQRFPIVLNTLVLNTSTTDYDAGTDVYTGYIGSFIGGPIYIRNTSVTFTAKISGGLEYLHYILGYTTEEEFNRIKQTSKVPYFDLEVWNFGVLHSGPRYYAENFSYDDIYKAATLWEKVSSVTTTGSSQGIVFIYDAFVAAGAAVAFPGRSSVNCPAGWMSGSLNYNGIVSSGSWGNFHEYHHNFQGYGVGNGGEVTNNGMTLVSYALFTKISSNRGISSYGAQGLGGWNNYTSATWALNDLLSIRRGGHPSNGDQGLAIYATLLHNFGANNYIQAKYTQQANGYGQSYAGYFRAWEKQTHNDMTYFFKDVLKGLDKSTANKFHNSEYTSMFVPVSCVYQTGRSYMYDGSKQYFKTMQPYMIAANKPFEIDLSKYNAPSGQYASGSIVIPDGFVYRVKSVTKPANGSIELVDNYNLKYTPAAHAKTGDTSGQIIVTLEILKNDGAFKVDDVDLVLEFEISQEINRMTLERTTYAYAEDAAYTDAQTAFENNFAGYTDKQAYDHSNPVQNANTDIWTYPDTEQNRKDHADAPEHFFSSDNKVDVIDGKLYFEADGKYRIYLRGRVNCAVYYSLNGQDYKIGAKVTNGSGANFYTTDSNTYFDVEFHEGNATTTVYCEGGEAKEYTYKLTPNAKGETTNWLYVKEILIVQSSPLISYIGLGYGTWTTPLYRMVEKHYDAEGNEVASPEAEGYHHSVTIYYDANDNEVPADVAAAAKPVAPTSATYVNAYRRDYEFPDNTGFESDYFYTRGYSCTYSESFGERGEFVGDHDCFYDANRIDFRPEYLLDGDKTTVALSKDQAHGDQDPWKFTVDLGKEITANRMTVTGYQHNGQNQTPTWLELYVSTDGENFELAYKNEACTVNGATVTADFTLQKFRYYRICAKNPSYNARTPAIADIEFSFSVPNGVIIAPTNENVIFSKNWRSRIAESTFGHVHVGNVGDTINFEFTGTRLAILSSDAYGKNFEVYIDGKKVSSIDIVEHSGTYGITFLTDKLASGKHKVEIRCTGEANIDSFAIFDEE